MPRGLNIAGPKNRAAATAAAAAGLEALPRMGEILPLGGARLAWGLLVQHAVVCIPRGRVLLVESACSMLHSEAVHAWGLEWSNALTHHDTKKLHACVQARATGWGCAARRPARACPRQCCPTAGAACWRGRSVQAPTSLHHAGDSPFDAATCQDACHFLSCVAHAGCRGMLSCKQHLEPALAPWWRRCETCRRASTCTGA
jgi:hypothetical protein